MLKLIFTSFFPSHMKRKDRCVTSPWVGTRFSGRKSWSPLNNSQGSEGSLGNLLTVSCGLRPRCYSPTGLVIMILNISGKTLKEHSLKIILSLNILRNAYQKWHNTHCWQGCREIAILINCWRECKLIFLFWSTNYKTYQNVKCVHTFSDSVISCLEFYPTEVHSHKCSTIYEQRYSLQPFLSFF